MNNKEFAQTDKVFIQACDCAGIKPTTRQASKWRMKRGVAWGYRTQAIKIIKENENKK